MATFSKTQIDKLGDRLRRGPPTEERLRDLDLYRHSFAAAYDEVMRRIRDELQLEPTGRPAKSTSSIAEKLQRESIRLSQIQDIAGCRIVVDQIAAQDRTVGALLRVFPDAKIVDRRAAPSHGYRAVHVVISIDTKPIEIQVRTSLQHMWAECCERLSDAIDPMIKYGGGGDAAQEILGTLSTFVARTEAQEATPESGTRLESRRVELLRSLKELAAFLATWKGS